MCAPTATAGLNVQIAWELCLMQADPRYETTTSVKTQIKFLEELDSLERKRHEEVQRGVLLRAAKVHFSVFKLPLIAGLEAICFPLGHPSVHYVHDST